MANRTFSVRHGLDVANTIVIDSNRNLSNIATANATTVNATNFLTVAGLNLPNHTNNAYNQANSAYSAANNRVLKSGDTMTGTLNVSALLISQNITPDSNLTYNIGSSTNRYLNVHANTVWVGGAELTSNGSALVISGIEVGGSNLVLDISSTYNQANAARDQANTALNTANGAYSQANGAYAHANIVYTQANNAYDQANSARNQANTGYGQANDAYLQANTARLQANSARDQANTARNTANDSYIQANSAANTVRVSQNSASTLSSKQLNFTNTASILAYVTDSGDGNANIAFTTSGASPGDAYNQANSAYNQANNAYNAANNAGTVQLTYDTTTTSEEVVDSFSTSTYRSAKYQMQIENTYGLQALSIMVLHDGSTTNLIKYGETTIGANVGSFTSDVSGGSVRLKFTATDPTTALTYFRYLLANRFNESIPNDLMTGNGTIDLMQTLLISPSDLNQ